MSTLATLLTTPLTTPEEADRWVRAMHAIGYGTHPDDRGADIVVAYSNEPLFTLAEADLYDARMDEACVLLDDVYAVAYDAATTG